MNYFDFDGNASLYRDGRQHLVGELPTAFPVPGGTIEVATTTFGLKRAHFVGGDGERQLAPVPGTAEHWRARLGARRPTLSRVMGIGAIIVLLVSLVIFVPQFIETITEIPAVSERIGTFTSPIVLPVWLNTVIAVAGVLAALERALTLRNHWLIDADTWLFGD